MRQITNTLIERKALKGPGTMFKGQKLNSADHYLEAGRKSIPLRQGQVQDSQNIRELGDADGFSSSAGILMLRRRQKEVFAPAGQTTQMIIGAGQETDRQILTTTENLYHTFKMKRVYYSAYIPVLPSPILPDVLTAPPLGREHRLYQADWLLRFYHFRAEELLDEAHPNFNPLVDPKCSWALSHPEFFPVEVNRADYEALLRVPGIGVTSARRILVARRCASLTFAGLKKLGVVLKRAQYFLTCGGKYLEGLRVSPDGVLRHLVAQERPMLPQGAPEQLSLFEQTG
jgi:predicted DNA-binding helix-hairpin-helix protein